MLPYYFLLTSILIKTGIQSLGWFRTRAFACVMKLKYNKWVFQIKQEKFNSKFGKVALFLEGLTFYELATEVNFWEELGK